MHQNECSELVGTAADKVIGSPRESSETAANQDLIESPSCEINLTESAGLSSENFPYLTCNHLDLDKQIGEEFIEVGGASDENLIQLDLSFDQATVNTNANIEYGNISDGYNGSDSPHSRSIKEHSVMSDGNLLLSALQNKKSNLNQILSSDINAITQMSSSGENAAENDNRLVKRANKIIESCDHNPVTSKEVNKNETYEPISAGPDVGTYKRKTNFQWALDQCRYCCLCPII